MTGPTAEYEEYTEVVVTAFQSIGLQWLDTGQPAEHIGLYCVPVMEYSPKHGDTVTFLVRDGCNVAFRYNGRGPFLDARTGGVFTP